MSTKTTFKRIALVASASLGFGLISAVPSNAQVLTSVSVTTVAGTGATTATSDSSTAATAALSFTSTAGANIGQADSVTVEAVLKSSPNGAASIVPTLMLVDTGTVNPQYSTVDTDTSRGGATLGQFNFASKVNDSAYTGSTSYASKFIVVKADSSTSGTVTANFKVYLDTSMTGTAVALTAGTYTASLIVTPYDHGAATLANTKIYDVNITVSALATASTTASASGSTAYIGSTRAAALAATTDSVLTALSTASTTLRASIAVKLLNAAGGNASESLTVTTNIGSVGTGSAAGRSVTIAYTGNPTYVDVFADGTAGTATITIKSTSVTFANKTVVFYASAPSTLVAKAINTSPGAGSTTAIAVDAKDASGNRFAGTLYTYSSAAGVMSNDAATCSYVAARDRHECSVTGVAAGTATITVRDAATVATSTVASNAVSLTVSTSSAATVKLAFDKASYAPGEKATLLVSVLDSAGKPLPANTFANLFTTGGITSNVAAGNGSETTTAISITTGSLQAADPTIANTDPVKAYTLYMPATGGTFTVSATGGTSLPLAGQVAVSASATVTDSGSQALAAVTALASQVSAFITKINAQITTLTDLVMKIQKKVKA